MVVLKYSNFLLCASCLGFLLVSTVGFSQETRDPDDMTRTAARVVEDMEVLYPPEELERGRQGWVKLNYVVDVDGRVVDPIVEDSSGSRGYELAVQKALEGFVYEPATLNGESVPQSFSGVMITFSSSESDNVMSGPFNRRYRETNRALAAEDFEEAARLIDDAFESIGLNVADLARLWMLRGRLAQGIGNDALQLASFRKAVVNDGGWVSNGDYRKLMVSIISLELSAGDYSAAIRSYNAFVEKAGVGAVPSNLRQAIDRANVQIEKYEILAVTARMTANRQCDNCLADWQYVPLRREFEIANIRGNLENIDIRCQWQRIVDVARKGVIWKLPDSWGECRIIVFGEEDSVFEIQEIDPELRN